MRLSPSSPRVSGLKTWIAARCAERATHASLSTERRSADESLGCAVTLQYFHSEGSGERLTLSAEPDDAEREAESGLPTAVPFSLKHCAETAVRSAARPIVETCTASAVDDASTERIQVFCALAGSDGMVVTRIVALDAEFARGRSV